MRAHKVMRPGPLRFLPLFFAPLTVLLASCGDGGTGPGEEPGDLVDLDRLFSAPTVSEVSAILDEWSLRTPTAENVVELKDSVLMVGATSYRLRVLSHDVEGVTHVGAILAPEGATPGTIPVLVFSHGGDQGLNLDITLPLLPFFLDPDDQFVFVVPSFRSEVLRFGGRDYHSTGEPSPWDWDVDDALSLLEVTFASTPQADPDRIGVLGFSRGACVGLLMAIREPAIDMVVEFFGPTDFFGPFVRAVTEEALDGSLRQLPGLDYLNDTSIQPLSRGEVTVQEVRMEMLRRSPVYFANRIPQLQVHHGTADATVPVEEAERLIQVLTDLGRTEPNFEWYLYEGGGHDPLGLVGSIPRTSAFLGRLSGSE